MNDQLVIAASEQVAARLGGILEAAGITAAAVCMTGAQAIESLRMGGILLTTWKLTDMSGIELAHQLPNSGVLMIVPQDYEGETGENVLTLRNPVSQDALVQAVRTLCFCQKRIGELSSKVEKLAKTLEERKLIDRAKGKLMDELHLTESQAHYHMQKKSMDSGRRISDVAREILEAGAADQKMEA